MLTVKVSAPPKDGKANKELVQTLADFFNVTKGDVYIVSGETSRHKRVMIELSEVSIANKMEKSLCENP